MESYGGCKRKIKVFVKIPKKKNLGEEGRVGGGGGVRVDVNEKLKFFMKIQKKNWGGEGRVGGGRVGLGGGEEGVRVDVNEELKFL